MKTEISPLIISLIILFLFVFAMLFLTHSFILFQEIVKVKEKLGNKAYNWLIGEEVKDEKV